MLKIVEKLKAKSISPQNESPIKIAVLGDSVTHGCFELIKKGENNFDCIYDYEAVYHRVLSKKIQTVYPNCPISVINAGISGNCATDGANRVERDVITSHPDLCIVAFGLNDSIQFEDPNIYTNALSKIFDALIRSEIECIYLTPNMMCTYKMPELLNDPFLNMMGDKCSASQNNGTLDAFVEAGKALCDEAGVTVCDCYSIWKKLAENGADIPVLLSNRLNHPTREMHFIAADALFKTIFN